jgi:5'-3' exonuclease
MATRIPRKRAYTKKDLKALPPEPKRKKTKMPDVDHVVVDGDSAVYAIAWGPKTQSEMERLYDKYVTDIMETLDTPQATVYVKGDNNFRYKVTPEYKASRKERKMDPSYLKRIDGLYSYLQDTYAKADGAEADDYCGVHHDELIGEGKIAVISHIDKDLNMIPGLHWNPTKKKLTQYKPDMSYNFLMRQIMMGDAGDSIQGLPGIGPVKALEELHHKYPAEFWQTVQDKFKKELGKSWKTTLLETANLIYIRQNYEDFRPLDWDEINDRLTWRGPDDGPVFLAQMDLEAMALDLDFDVVVDGRKDKRWWGEIKTKPTDLLVPKRSNAKKRLEATLNILGADKATN